MSPSDSDDSDEDEHESTDSDTDEDTGRHDSSIRLDIGLQPVTDLVRGLVDVDVSNPPRESNRKGDENQSQPDRESRSRWSKSISTRPNRERTSADTTRETADSYHVTAHRSDDEATIVADLPGVEADELSVGLAEDSNAFVIAVDGTVVRRVSLPWNHAEVSEARFNNSILEVRLHSADEGDD